MKEKTPKNSAFASRDSNGYRTAVHRLTLILLLAGLALWAGTAPAQVWTGPSFSAVKVESSFSEPGEVIESTVYLSKHGMREETPVERGTLITIVNYDRKKAWYIRPDKKLYAEASQDPGTEHPEPPAFVKQLPEHLQAMMMMEVSTLLDDAPCRGYDRSQRLGNATVDGRSTVKWGCGKTSTQRSILQWYDPKLKIVIREETDAGDRAELQKITVRPISKSLFALPQGYRKVTLDKIMPDMPMVP